MGLTPFQDQGNAATKTSVAAFFLILIEGVDCRRVRQTNGIGPAVTSPRASLARGRSLVCRRVAGEPAATMFRRGRLRYFGQAPDQAERRSPSCRRTERLLNGAVRREARSCAGGETGEFLLRHAVRQQTGDCRACHVHECRWRPAGSTSSDLSLAISAAGIAVDTLRTAIQCNARTRAPDRFENRQALVSGENTAHSSPQPVLPHCSRKRRRLAKAARSSA